jgi:hypothetical protein
VVTPSTIPVLAAPAPSGHTPGEMFDSSWVKQLTQSGTHCVGTQAEVVKFLVIDTALPPLILVEPNGVQLSVQLDGGM